MPVITPTGGGSGGSQPYTLVRRGPYTIAYNTPADVSGTGSRQYQRLAPLASGEIIYDVLHMIDVPWAGPDSDSLVFFCGVYDDYFDTPTGGVIDTVKQYRQIPENSGNGPMGGPVPQDWHQEAIAGFGNFVTGPFGGGSQLGVNNSNPMLIVNADTTDPFEVGYFAVEIDWAGTDPTAGQSTFYTLVFTAA